MSDTKVFISHSHDDSGWSRAFVDALAKKGLSLWYDDLDLKPGDRLSDAIDRALRESDAIVFILSPGAIDSKALFWELGAAVALNKQIIPIIWDDLDRSKVPVPLLQKRYLVRREPDETAEEVARAVA